MKNTKIVELVIDDDSQELAIDAISLVSAPAIEQDFVFFGKEKNNLTFAKVDEDKRMLVSPALIPNKQIFRHDPNTDTDYYVYFSSDTVRKASELYLKNNNHHKATYEHSDRVSGVLTVESWIIEDTKTDKSTLYGFSLPKGTWMVKMKIENDELWNKIKSGEVKGLSIEGYFTNKFEQMQKKQPTDLEILSALNEIISENKTKLKAEKIELNDVKKLTAFGKFADDMRTYILGNIKSLQTLSKAVNDAKKEALDLEQNIKDAKQLEKDINKIKQDVTNAAKELGISPNEIPAYSDTDEKQARLRGEIDQAEQTLAGVNSVIKF
jgi:hypothetical protein